MLQEGSFENSEPIIRVNSAARTSLKGSPPQQLHIDSRYPGAPFALYVQVFFCLDDFMKENGATRVVPGSHKIIKYDSSTLSSCFMECRVIIFCALLGDCRIFLPVRNDHKQVCSIYVLNNLLILIKFSI